MMEVLKKDIIIKGAVAYVNNEYLKVNKIVDSHGKLIQIDGKRRKTGFINS